jgi:hypothetical protein
MRKSLSALFLSSLILAISVLVACGGSYMAPMSPTTPSASTVPVSLTIGDDPPTGVAILRFQVEITAATLQPSDTSQMPISILLGPMNVELLHLQTETAPLGNMSVPAGSYTGLTASFANPVMTIYNNSGSTLTVGSQSCNNNQFCIINPSLNAMSATVAAPTSPFPLTLSSSSPVGFEMHFDVNTSVQGNLTVTPTISVKQIVPPVATTPISTFHLVGRVSSISSPDFTLQAGLGLGGLTANIETNSSTNYHFGQNCTADDFGCLMDGQVVDVKVGLFPGGTLIAENVHLLEQQNVPSLQGIVVNVNAADNEFTMLLLDLQENFTTAVTPGFLVNVQLSNSTTFSVNSDDVTVPSELTFSSAASLIDGQTVEIQPGATPVAAAGSTGTMPMFSVDANAITLEPTALIGVVGTVNAGATPPNFILTQLSPFFTHAGISTITVDSVSGTQYFNVSGLSGLTAGNTVGVGGLLFNNSGSATIVAEGVLLH